MTARALAKAPFHQVIVYLHTVFASRTSATAEFHGRVMAGGESVADQALSAPSSDRAPGQHQGEPTPLWSLDRLI